MYKDPYTRHRPCALASFRWMQFVKGTENAEADKNCISVVMSFLFFATIYLTVYRKGVLMNLTEYAQYLSGREKR